ncbi:cytochrome P450 306a1 [Lutzomyia longipalpis]|uniref:cytochrome P450 306a1 n=1 Tax=Lutzomyia longipalpis TaxID=7200 RepID=UPI0024843EFD|nr:cytochrome P450 306a1 [Lutzomyia longipalpis]
MITILYGIFAVIAVAVTLRLFRQRNTPPGPWGLPIVGSLFTLDSQKPYLTLTKLSEKYGKIFGLHLGSVYTVVLSDSALIRDVLKREEFTGRAPLYLTHGIMGGYGLICSEGNLWRDHRKMTINWLKMLGMAKYNENRNSLETRILNGVNGMINEMDGQIGKEMDLMPVLQHHLGNILNDLIFGVKYKSDDSTWRYLQHLQEEGVKHIGVSGPINFLPFLRHIPHFRRTIQFLLDGKAKTHKIYGNLVAKANNEGRKDNILSLFLQEKSKQAQLVAGNSEKLWSDEQLKHVLADLFGAGLDTTNSTIRWILLYMAKNPEVQRKVHQEMFRALTTCPRLEHYDDLPYLRACIAEGQRIRSVVPVGIPHGTNEDTKISGYRIPKGTMILPLQWAVHMNPQIWNNPEDFSPERFIDANGQFQASQHLIPFQTGKRICLGEELARMLMFLTVGNILYNFQLSCVAEDDISGICGITLTPPDHKLIASRRIF